jgi:SAM-dependent methyltransferase
MSAPEYVYEGSELDLFARAENWKRYWSAHVRPYLGQRVLEVGAGIGVNTPFLNRGALEWVCLEPDKNMAAMLVEQQRATKLAGTHTIGGLITDLPCTPSFDSIIYIDVLEHIKDDSAEIAAATERLRPNGTLIVLSPAHAWLFSAFDAAIGHHRRYSPKDLCALTRPELELISLRQLDSVGTIASLANSFVLRSQMPTLSQILLWDRIMVPISQLLDPLLAYHFGKSILAVWRRRSVDTRRAELGS